MLECDTWSSITIEIAFTTSRQFHRSHEQSPRLREVHQELRSPARASAGLPLMRYECDLPESEEYGTREDRVWLGKVELSRERGASTSRFVGNRIRFLVLLAMLHLRRRFELVQRDEE